MSRDPSLLSKLRYVALSMLASSAGLAAHAAEQPIARRCVLLASTYETQGVTHGDMVGALRINTRNTQSRLLQRLQDDRLVANAALIDVDGPGVSSERVKRVQEISGCDTVVEIRNVLSTFFLLGGGVFGFDVAVNRRVGEAETTIYSRQYRYGLDRKTLSSFTYDGAVDAIWNDLRAADVLGQDREVRALDASSVRAEYDHLVATWPRDLPEYHLRHILVETEAPGFTLIGRLHEKGPPDFAVLAATSSQDTPSSTRGGDAGWLQLSALPKEIADAVRERDGQLGLIEHPIHSDDGWHVVEILGVRQSHPPAFLDAAASLAASMRWNAVVPAAVWAQAQIQQ